MHVVLIPFFLAANVTTFDSRAWIYGPEYVFDVNITHALSDGLLGDALFQTSVITTLKCRPKSMDQLLCHFEGITVEDMSGGHIELGEIGTPFVIEFSPRGIQNIGFSSAINKRKLNILRKIFKELSTEIDLSKYANVVLPHLSYAGDKDYPLNDCSSLFVIYELYDSDNLHRSNREQSYDQSKKQNYNLEVLSLPNRNTEKTVIFEKWTDKRNSRCHPTLQKTMTNFEIDEYISRMSINNNTFESETRISQRVSNNIAKRNFTLQDITSVKLLGIKPATDPLPFLNFDKFERLHPTEAMDNNNNN
ncbi:uncharacterized protein LOC132907756 [Bombus pascuorum]|uniref:uncharacterized protein LOC132907756 n=1 Tax=Bombus pascuorum TaxID=65598 RepID=UPI00213EF893|nr:uncharacterized protein LOC132907756 [Bombus pascuorum]